MSKKAHFLNATLHFEECGKRKSWHFPERKKKQLLVNRNTKKTVQFLQIGCIHSYRTAVDIGPFKLNAVGRINSLLAI